MFEKLLARLGRGLDAHGIPYMLIGGQAVLLHGEPRATIDIDITLGVDVTALPRLLDLARQLELTVLPSPVEPFVTQTNVLPLRDARTTIRVDFIFSFTPYERQAIERSVIRTVAGQSLHFSSAEDLILHKLFAGRPRDVEDVRGVVARKGKTLDTNYLRKWAKEFSMIEGKEHLSSQLEQLLPRE